MSIRVELSADASLLGDDWWPHAEHVYGSMTGLGGWCGQTQPSWCNKAMTGGWPWPVLPFNSSLVTWVVYRIRSMCLRHHWSKVSRACSYTPRVCTMHQMASCLPCICPASCQGNLLPKTLHDNTTMKNIHCSNILRKYCKLRGSGRVVNMYFHIGNPEFEFCCTYESKYQDIWLKYLYCAQEVLLLTWLQPVQALIN